MPRRSPPSSLRLVTGPIPARGRPKHTLPVVPQPTFYPWPSTSQQQRTLARVVIPPLVFSTLDERRCVSVKPSSISETDIDSVPSPGNTTDNDSPSETARWVHSWLPEQASNFVFNVESVLPLLPKAVVVNSYA